MENDIPQNFSLKRKSYRDLSKQDCVSGVYMVDNQLACDCAFDFFQLMELISRGQLYKSLKLTLTIVKLNSSQSGSEF